MRPFRFLLILLLLLSPLAHATQTDNHGIHAVPAPGPVVIDGRLNDWDTSGQVLMCYDIENLRDIYSAEVAMMHDATNLYVAIHWKDPFPMGNSHDPRYQANMGWAGDAVQLRFKTDRIAHVTAWYYATGKEPAMQIDYGKSLTEAFGGGQALLLHTQGWQLSNGAAMAFQKDVDNRGYVQEIKLPWNLISTGKAPAPGEQFSCGIELLWGEANWPVHRYADNLQPGTSSREFFWDAVNNWGPVFVEPKGHLHLPTPAYILAAQKTNEAPSGPVAIRYSLPAPARVTIALEDASGKRVRNLIAAAPRPKGANVEHWDGLNDDGQPVPPGRYVVKALRHDGIHANWVMSFANPGHPTWNTPDGHGAFYADHTAPQAAAAGGDYVALACPMGEGGPHLIGCDLNGQRLWGLSNRTAFDGGHIALATDGKTLWVANEGKEAIIYRVDMATGKYAPWNSTSKDAEGREFKTLDLKVSDLPGVGADPKLGANLSAIAVYQGVLAVCLARENKVKLLDAETGATVEELDVPNPHGVAFDPRWHSDRSLLVLSGDRLVNVWRKNSYPVLFQPVELPSGAYVLTTDANGKVYVSIRGERQNVQVLKITSDGGGTLRLDHEIGNRGGRLLNGPFNPNAMYNPGGIAVDSRGRLWVPEETMNPKRTSVWSLDGKLVKSLDGTTTYAGAGALNPLDSTMGFSDNTVYRVNLQTGAWMPVYSLAASDDPNDIFPPRADSHVRVLTHGGNTYVYTTDNARGSVEMHCTLWDGKRWRSVAHIGVVKTEYVDQWAKYKNPLFAGHDNQSYAWADRNGDGLAQADELTFAALQADGKSAELRSFYWGQLPDVDGTVAYMAGGSNALWKFPIASWTPAGAPTYDIAHPRVVTLDQKVLGMGNGEGMIMGGSNGWVYLNQDPLIAVDSNGKVWGGYPNHHTSVHGSHTATAAKPGYLIGPSSILGTANIGGEAGEVFYLNGNLGENYIFTRDGLWVQSLFKDTRGYFDAPSEAVRGMSFDATTAGGESFGGQFSRAADGKDYVVLGGTDARVLEVTGLNSIHRFGGFINYTPAQYTVAQRLMQQRLAQTQAPKTYTVATSPMPPAIDGKADDWPGLLDDKAPAIEIREDAGQRYARVQARYDGSNLYLAYRVFTPSGQIRNSGQNEKLLFKTGDVVDLMLGPASQNGDVSNERLLLSMMGGKPIAVLYQKSVPGTSPQNRVPFSSPSRTIFFDRVSVVPDVRVATGSIEGGYFVEAAIPWRVLGITPHAGLQFKADAGALFADEGGNQTIARHYWSNLATGLVNDVPGEAELTPGLWGAWTLD